MQWKTNAICEYVNGPIDKYIVQYTSQPNGTLQSKEKTTDKRSRSQQWVPRRMKISLTELTPHTNYSIQTAALNTQGNVGPYSAPIIGQTDEDSKLRNRKNIIMVFLLLSSSPAPGPVVITSFPSFFKITITWEEPAMPNGIITHYEVYYGAKPADYPPSVVNTTNTSFTTPGHLEPGTEMIFTVKAYTKVGGGVAATISVFTFIRPRELIHFVCQGISCLFPDSQLL